MTTSPTKMNMTNPQRNFSRCFLASSLLALWVAGCLNNSNQLGQLPADDGGQRDADVASDVPILGTGGGSGGVTGRGGSGSGGIMGTGGIAGSGGAGGGTGGKGTGGANASGGATGTQCGGLAGLSCSGTDFCEFTAAACKISDAMGTCTTRPQVCPDVYLPVCGCDGKTYSNDCTRQSAGASKAADGACSTGTGGTGGANGTGGRTGTGGNGGTGGSTGTQCGGEAGIPCPSTYFCELYAGDCIRVSDSFGVCVKIPEGCVAGGSGVCSCNGKTYTNDCERQMNSQSKAYDGPCSVDAGN